MEFKTSIISSTLLGLPPGLADGRKSLMSSPWSGLKSDEYIFLVFVILSSSAFLALPSLLSTSPLLKRPLKLP